MDAPDLLPRPDGAARYTVRLEDHVTALLRLSAGAQRRVRVRYAVYAAVTLGLWLVTHPWAAFSTRAMLLYAAVVFAGWALARPLFVRRQAEAHVRGRADLGRTAEARVDGTRLVVRVDGVVETAYQLGALHGVEAFPDGLLVQPFPSEGLWIPADGFASEADRRAFERALLAGAPLPSSSF